MVNDSSRRLTWSSYVTDPFQFPQLLSDQSTTTHVDTQHSAVNTVSSQRLDADVLLALEPLAQSAALEQPAVFAQPLHSPLTAHSSRSISLEDTTLLKVPVPFSLSTHPQVDTLTSEATETR